MIYFYIRYNLLYIMASISFENKSQKISEFDRIKITSYDISYLLVPLSYYDKKTHSYTNVATNLKDIATYSTSYIINNVFTNLWGEYDPDYKNVILTYNLINFHNKLKET